MRKLLVGLLAVMMVFAVACSKNEAGHHAKKHHGAKKAKKVSAMEAGAMRAIGKNLGQPKLRSGHEYAWTLPAGWANRENSGTSLASFRAKEGDAVGHVSLMELTGDGGGVPKHVNRWREQLGLPKLADDVVSGSGKEEMGTFGPFKVFDVVNPDKPEKAFLAALIPVDNATAVVRLKTKAESVSALEPSFIEFCKKLALKAKAAAPPPVPEG